MKKQFKICLTAAMAILMLWSCDKSETAIDPLDSVPSDAVAVAKADVLNLLSEAGCQAEAGRYSLTPALQSLLGASDTSTLTLVSLLADLAPEIDLESVYWYMPSAKSQPIVTTLATDGTALLDRLDQTSTASVKISDYSIYTYPGACAVVRDGQIWIARSADLIIDTNDTAARKSFSSDSVKKGALDAEGDIVAVVSWVPASVPGIDVPVSSFITASMRCLRSGFHLHAGLKAPDGTPVYIGSDIGVINPSFVSLIPRQTAVCIALGALDWQETYPSVVDALGGICGDNWRMILSMLRPYIESIDGTVAIAVAPAAGAQSLGDFDLSSWEVCLTASMPQEKLDQLTTLVSTLASMSDFPCKSNRDGTYTLALGDDKALTVGSVKGNFVIANYDVAIAGAPVFAPVFDSKVLAIEANIPYGGDLSRIIGLPWGLSVDAGVGGGEADATVKLNGINTTPLKALVETLAK